MSDVVPAPERPRPPLVRWATFFYAALAAVALGWNAWADTPWAFADAEARSTGVRWLRDAALGLLTGAVVVVASRGLAARTRWGERASRELGRAIGPLRDTEALYLAALSGFAEEVFFRGALQPRVGWLAASLLFGLAHFAPSRVLLPWTGFAIAAGGILGGLYAATGNLVAPVLAHALVNALNLRWLSRRYAESPDAPA